MGKNNQKSILRLVGGLSQPKEKKVANTKGDLTETGIKEILRKHPIFHEMSRYETILTNNINVEDPLKKKLVTCYLKLLCRVVLSILDDVVEHYDRYNNGNIQNLTSLMYQRYSDLRVTAMSQGVPEIFLNKITPRLIENLLSMANTVIDLYQPNRYNNQYEEILTFMDVYLLQIRYNYNAITGIVNSMNGELHRALEGSVFDNY